MTRAIITDVEFLRGNRRDRRTGECALFAHRVTYFAEDAARSRTALVTAESGPMWLAMLGRIVPLDTLCSALAHHALPPAPPRPELALWPHFTLAANT